MDKLDLLIEYTLTRDMLQSVSMVLEQQYMQWAQKKQESQVTMLNDEFKSPLINTQVKLTERFAELRLLLSAEIGIDMESYFKEESAIIT